MNCQFKSFREILPKLGVAFFKNTVGRQHSNSLSNRSLAVETLEDRRMFACAGYFERITG